MFLLFKLKALFDALKALAAKFPDARLDAEQLFADVEHAVLTKAWTLASVQQVITDAEKLVTDFAAEWTGGRAELEAFVRAFRAIFAS